MKRTFRTRRPREPGTRARLCEYDRHRVERKPRGHHSAPIGDGAQPLGSIEIFDHTADVGLKVRGSDLNDLFRTAAQGVLDYIVVNRHDVRVEQRDALSLEA